tara:strand:- start:205 stop:414 length:210 start_codon:yes stop_codon:yes gene_type:complete
MRCAENGVIVKDQELLGFSATYWRGDRYECQHPDCNHAVIVGFGIPVPAYGNLRPEALVFDYTYRAPHQ